MGTSSSKQKHFDKAAYPYGRSSYRVEELLQSSAYQTWVMEYEKTPEYKTNQTLPEKLPREVERDLLERHCREHAEELTQEVKRQLSIFSQPTVYKFELSGKLIQLNVISKTMCKILGPPRTKDPTLVGECTSLGFVPMLSQ
ncbi:uncharacterized protein MONOS_14626 [Monocercomonoides exilis]|uniref:uncharacterized protein n=1 Tax=Monocercomonoides exilis TaxID=2049356 RepID=UPI00355A0F84|nr:hypothetical protein MONOS_14626 [Monocercomonoides exilis]|eukprot:MONOS_14626.1-p1 / transcript=MONOS_14626.1 / gene=MONOS_14626 / organism=Monocercomonoides_exilis_PA203 / gene_product=unspecified product / transcript_product=unspecified product / location=Mono_scaffold01037:469-982(-) / protein_length=142 / sequence_SO=supercontig / SO=protein_coding / is_pseudo=false